MVKWIKDTAKREKLGTILIFFGFGLFLLLQLVKTGSMAQISGDAGDIWKTIKTYYTDEMYPSYVMYKGFAAVYPYVWLYKLAQLFHTNEFFFVMLYHAVLFGYTIAIGIPVLVKTLTNYNPKFWQKILLGIVVYSYWSRSLALGQLMVDFPSCVYFLMTIHCASLIKQSEGKKKYIWLVLSGLLSGLIANISGQYSVAAICTLIYAGTQIWEKKSEDTNERKRWYKNIFNVVVLLAMMMVAKACNVLFDYFVIQPIVAGGIPMKTGKEWLERALLYMLDLGRVFYGPNIYDARGQAIVMDIYGNKATEMMELAAQGKVAWSIPTYLINVLKYPVDFVMLYLNRVMIMLSDDGSKSSLSLLLPGYTMYYLAICTCVKRLKKFKDVFQAKTWLVLAAFASVIPMLVTTVELRITIGVQALCFGVALAGPMLPQMWAYITAAVKQCKEEKSLRCIAEKPFPWEVVGWVVFCLVCLAYFGALCGNSDMGTGMLYKW